MDDRKQHSMTTPPIIFDFTARQVHNETADYDQFVKDWGFASQDTGIDPLTLTPEQRTQNKGIVDSIMTRCLADVQAAPKPSPEQVDEFLAHCERVMADAKRCAAQTYHRTWWQRLCSHLRG